MQTVIASIPHSSARALARALVTLLALLALAALAGCSDAARSVGIATEPADQTVTAGATAAFAVVANGPVDSYQWKRNGADIAGATSARYTTPATAASDDGALYSVVVTGRRNTVTSRSARLTVVVPPAITTQPANASVQVGQTATFTVAATGSATLTYQWRRGGTAIAGATSASYTTPATVAGDDGALFSVVVTNAVGSVTSADARLTVVAPPPPATGAWGAELRLDTLPVTAAGLEVAVDRSTGNAVVVWTQPRNGAHAVLASRYARATGTWSGPDVLVQTSDRLEHTYDPSAAINAAGDVVVAWAQNFESSEGGKAMVVRFEPGTGWTQPIQASRISGGPAGDILNTFDPAVAIDAAGNAVLAWIEDTYFLPAAGANATRVEFMAATTWSRSSASPVTAQLLEDSTLSSRSEEPRVVIDDAGNATVAWLRDVPNSPSSQVVTRRYAASSWEDPVIHAQGNDVSYSWLDVVVNAVTGDVLLGWGGRLQQNQPRDIVVRRYARAGGTWSATTSVESDAADAAGFYLAINGLNQAAILRERSDTTTSAVLVSRIDMTNGSASAPVTLASNGYLYGPSVGVDGSGTVYTGHLVPFAANNRYVARRLPSGGAEASFDLSAASTTTLFTGLGVADDGSAVAAWITSGGVYVRTYR